MITWNIFHGRALPAAGRPLLAEYCSVVAGWEWDVLLLQECPPWWPELLARAAGATSVKRMTSRSELLAARKAIAVRNPDLIRSNGGGCDAILARGEPLTDHRELRLSWRPERRWVHGARVGSVWVVNVHANGAPKTQTAHEARVSGAAALRWAGGAPVVFGGDFNMQGPPVPEPLVHAGGHNIDHVFVAGGPRAAGKSELLDAKPLSDHWPVAINLEL